MFLYIYVDYYHLYRPGILDDIQAGLVFEFEISPPLMTAFLALLAVPSLMITLSVVLPAQANRIANLLVAALYIPVTAFNAVGESWEWAPFYVLSIGVELLQVIGHLVEGVGEVGDFGGAPLGEPRRDLAPADGAGGSCHRA